MNNELKPNQRSVEQLIQIFRQIQANNPYDDHQYLTLSMLKQVAQQRHYNENAIMDAIDKFVDHGGLNGELEIYYMEDEERNHLSYKYIESKDGDANIVVTMMQFDNTDIELLCKTLETYLNKQTI